MDIQFHHVNYDHVPKSTYAVILPNAVEFTSALENPSREITLAVGKAKCSPKDQYCKKTGREVALDRMSPIIYRLITMSFYEDGGIQFLLSSETGSITVKMSEKSQRLHLLQVND